METRALVQKPPQPCQANVSLKAVWLMAGVAALVLYAVTVAPDVLMMDSGEYQWLTWLFPQVEPPQGLQNLVRVHWNYLLAAKAFALAVPLGHWALRINLFSAVMASIAVGNVCTLACGLTRSGRAVALTWLALALGQTFWQYSTIAEVLAMQAATVSAEILFLWLWTTSDKVRWLVALWAINGVAVGTHVQSGLATPVYLVLTLMALRQGKVQWRHIALCAAVWLAGVAPYLLYCLKQIHSSGMWAGAATAMTAGTFGDRMLQVSPRVLLRGLLSIGLNYPTGLGLLLIPGVLWLVHNRAIGEQTPRRFRWGWLTVLGINLAFVMTYNVPDQQSFFVPLYAAAGPLIGLGAMAVLRSRAAWVAAFVLAVMVVPVYAVLPILVKQPMIAERLPMPAASTIPYRDPHEFYLKPWKTGRHNERRYVEEVLAVLPEGAVFYCPSTAHDAFRAIQEIEGRRRDVVLNPPVASLIEQIVRTEDGVVGWRQSVYSWAEAGAGVPKVLRENCAFVPRGIVWEVVLPQDLEALLRDMPQVRLLPFCEDQAA